MFKKHKHVPFFFFFFLMLLPTTNSIFYIDTELKAKIEEFKKERLSAKRRERESATAKAESMDTSSG